MPAAEQFVQTLWRRRLSFLATFALVLTGVAIATFALPKVYSTQTFVLVSGTRLPSSDYEATQTNQVLTKTYAELLQTRNVANAVAVALPYASRGAEVQGAASVTPVAGTQLIRIDAEESTGARAQTLANTYARVFVGQFGRFAGTSVRTGRVTLAQAAPRPASPSRPKPKLYLIVGALLAAFAAAGVALLRQRFDQRLQIEPSTTELHGLPILARVPQQRDITRAITATDGSYGRSQVSEAFGLLLVNLTFANIGTQPRSLAVVSSSPSEGKSTTSLAIGRAAIEAGIDAVVVDADLRRPSLAAMLRGSQPPTSPGFSSLLVGAQRVQAAPARAARSPGVLPNVIPSGPLPPNPAALLGSGNLNDLKMRLQEHFPLVIFDTPPVSVGADASLVSSSCDAAVIVVDASKTKRDALLRAVDQLRRANANIIGIVVNRVPAGMAQYGYEPAHGSNRSEEPTARDAPSPNGASAEELAGARRAR